MLVGGAGDEGKMVCTSRCGDLRRESAKQLTRGIELEKPNNTGKRRHVEEGVGARTHASAVVGSQVGCPAINNGGVVITRRGMLHPSTEHQTSIMSEKAQCQKRDQDK